MAGSIPVLVSGEVNTEQGPVVYQRVDTNADAFGGAQAKAMMAVGEGVGNLGAFLKAKGEDQEKNQVLQAYSNAKDKVRNYLFDPFTGYYNTRGSQATGGLDKFNKFTDDLMANAQEGLTPKGKEVFKKMWLNDRDTLSDSVMRHENSQHEEYNKEAQLGVVKSAIDMASANYNDDKIINKSIDDIRRVIRANNIGSPPEYIADLEKQSISSLYKTVLLRAAYDDPSSAEGLLKKFTPSMSGDDIIEASRALAPAMRKSAVNGAFTTITGTGGAARTLTEYSNNTETQRGDYQVPNDGSNASKLVSAMVKQESGGNPNAESPVGAAGLLQVMPSTAREISLQLKDGMMAGLSDAQIKQALKDPKVGMRYGMYYMQQQLTRYDGDLEAALVAYNAGSGNADKWLKNGRDYSILPDRRQTEGYVHNIMSMYIEGGGFKTDMPDSGIRMTRDNWSLKFYKPQDMMAPTAGGQWVEARSATMMDGLGSKFERKWGIRLSINDPHDFNLKPGQTAGKRRGTADILDNPHVKKSQHLFGRAFDVQIQGLTDEQKADFLRMALSAGFQGIGFYEGGPGHLHLDTGRKRQWGRVPAWASKVMAEGITSKTPPTSYGGSVSKPPVGNTSPSNVESPTTTTEIAVYSPSNDQVSSIQSVKVDPNEGDLESWMAEADTIEDEDIRNAVKAKISVEWNRREAVRKRNKKIIEEEAWKYVENGGYDSIPPELSSKLDHEFKSSALTYEEKMATHGKIDTDYKTYYELTRMEDKEFIDLDLMKYRSYLDNEKMDKLMARQAELLRKSEGKSNIKYDGLRTRNQIVDDSVAAAGLDKKDKAADIGRIDSMMDQEVSNFIDGHNRDPNPIEIQAMVDRLLLKDRAVMWGADTLANASKDGEALKDFKAVDDASQIPPNDYKSVVEVFQKANGRSPSVEEMTGIYNEAMKVYVGGEVDIPPDKYKELEVGLTSRLGRKPSDQEIKKYYSMYLLKFIGM